MATNNNRETIYIPLEDVESEHCALIVEKGLAKVDGVASPKVEINNHRAAISIKDTETVGKAVAAIKDLGYGVPTVKILSRFWG
jgi:Heavy-metal-associated domain.